MFFIDTLMKFYKIVIGNIPESKNQIHPLTVADPFSKVFISLTMTDYILICIFVQLIECEANNY